MKMFKSGMPSKREAQKIVRDTKAKAATAAGKGDRLAARQYQVHADLIADKLQNGDYDD